MLLRSGSLDRPCCLRSSVAEHARSNLGLTSGCPKVAGVPYGCWFLRETEATLRVSGNLR